MALIKHVDGVDIPMTPEEEAAFLASLPPPLNPVPQVISDRQFYQQLAVAGTITQAEALAAVMTGTIPEVLDTFIQSLPAPDQFTARMLLAGATQFERQHPLVAAVGAAQGLTTAQIDDFFRAAALL